MSGGLGSSGYFRTYKVLHSILIKPTRTRTPVDTKSLLMSFWPFSQDIIRREAPPLSSDVVHMLRHQAPSSRHCTRTPHPLWGTLSWLDSLSGISSSPLRRSTCLPRNPCTRRCLSQLSTCRRHKAHMLRHQAPSSRHCKRTPLLLCCRCRRRERRSPRARRRWPDTQCILHTPPPRTVRGRQSCLAHQCRDTVHCPHSLLALCMAMPSALCRP